MKIARTFGPLALALCLQGCAAAGLAIGSAGASVGMGAGVEHTINGVVYKTFAVSTNELRFAALKTLDRMAMPVTEDAQSEEGWKLTATAANRSIDIELQRLSEQATRMRVVANQGSLFYKDASTATEIITQTSLTLQNDQDTKAATERYRKRKPS